MSAVPARAQHPEAGRSPAVDYVIDIVNLSKSFRRSTRSQGKYSTIKSAALNFLRPQAKPPVRPHKEGITHVIQGLTMRIPRGASVGLIGRNGSGKSTFLKLVTGIYKPTSGSVSVLGRVAALIELGAGFHPDFTGRENLMLAGVMHGLSRSEVEARFDDIVSFAELEDVIDDPVRTYSSGMFMRLGFSIAVHTDPDVLLVDEVLAVGDAGFVAKCKERISELRKAGKTLVLVTHDLESVERWCDEAIWLHEGVVKERGYPRRVIDAYRHFIEKGEELQILEEERAEADAPAGQGAPGAELDQGRWGSREVEITGVQLLDEHGREARVFHPNDPMRIQFSYKANSPQADVVCGIGIHRGDGLSVFGTNTDIDRIELPALKPSGVIECAIGRVGLLDGAFSLDVALHRRDGYAFDYHKGAIHFSVRSDSREVGVVSPLREWRVHGEACRCSP
jgi:ABC-type polysaccharide/polyol phosphate transport system ATPase subunit